MDFTAPHTLIMDSQMIVAVVAFFIFTTAGVVWGYSKLLGNINQRFDASDAKWLVLDEKFSSMEERNERADKKTTEIEVAQRIQETTIAIMANDTSHTREGMVRLEKSINDLMLYIRDNQRFGPANRG